MIIILIIMIIIIIIITLVLSILIVVSKECMIVSYLPSGSATNQPGTSRSTDWSLTGLTDKQVIYILDSSSDESTDSEV